MNLMQPLPQSFQPPSEAISPVIIAELPASSDLPRYSRKPVVPKAGLTAADCRKTESDAPVLLNTGGQTEVQEVAFLLLPGATTACLTAAISVLRLANRLADQAIFRWQLFSADGAPVMTEEGFRLDVHQQITAVDPASLSKLVVCGGHRFDQPEVMHWLKRAAKKRLAIGAIGQGSYALARAGLLSGYSCTIHWEYMASLREEYPQLLVTSQLFVVDRDRFSCAGGGGVQGMMLHLLAQEQGAELAKQVSEMLICGMRLPDEPQRAASSRSQAGYLPPRLREAISLMESNISEPLQLQELAQLLGISRRQLERLFRKYLNRQPSRFYMELRLNRARQLLQQTSLSVIEIAVACGFSTASHFSRSIKDQFGCSPKHLCMQPGFLQGG